MKNATKRVLSMLLAMLMLLPLISVPTFAASTANGEQDFESFAAGKPLTTADGFSAVAPFN